MDQGEALILEAPSGAGKSTLLRLLTGLIPRSQGGAITGRVHLDGRPVHRIDASELPRRIGWMPQDPETAFVARTVERELVGVLANAAVPKPEWQPRIEETLHEFGASHLAAREVATLSGGEAARCALAAATVCRPDLLVLDEPAGQLDAAASRELAGTLRALKAGGTTLALAAHRPHPFGELADQVLELPGTPAAAPAGPPGRELPEPQPGVPLASLDGAVHRFEGGTTVGPLDLEVHPGEVVALTGPNGSGKTTALHLLAGLHDPQQGTVEVGGKAPAELPAPALASRLGISFQHPAWHITQDSVRQEVALTARLLGLPARAEAVANRLGLAGLLSVHPWDLSGGERQRLAVATALAHQPPLLLLDEPTRGLDAAGLARFAALLAERVEKGKATVVATHHPWLVALAHREVPIRAEAEPRLPRPQREVVA